jgi:hypothetical protein
MIYCLFDNILYGTFLIGHKYVQVGSRYGRIRNELASLIRIHKIQDYGSVDPDPKEIFADPDTEPNSRIRFLVGWFGLLVW